MFESDIHRTNLDERSKYADPSGYELFFTLDRLDVLSDHLSTFKALVDEFPRIDWRQTDLVTFARFAGVDNTKEVLYLPKSIMRLSDDRR